MRDRTFALHQTLGNTPAHSGKLEPRTLTLWWQPCRLLRCRRPAFARLRRGRHACRRRFRFGGGADISFGDTTVRTCSFDIRKVDAELSCNTSRDGRSFHARFVFTLLWWQPCRLLWCRRHACRDRFLFLLRWRSFLFLRFRWDGLFRFGLFSLRFLGFLRFLLWRLFFFFFFLWR